MSPVLQDQGDHAQIVEMIKESNAMIRDLTAEVKDQSIMLAKLQSDLSSRDKLDLEVHGNLRARLEALETNQKWFVISVITLVLNAVKDYIFK